MMHLCRPAITGLLLLTEPDWLGGINSSPGKNYSVRCPGGGGAGDGTGRDDGKKVMSFSESTGNDGGAAEVTDSLPARRPAALNRSRAV